jgi:hypothetical protein
MTDRSLIETLRERSETIGPTVDEMASAEKD